MMRRLHRWISIVAAVFLLNVAITGSLLAVDELKDRVFGISPGGPRAETAPRPQAPGLLPPNADLGAMINKVYAAAYAADPDDPITMIRLQVQNGELEGLVQYNGENPNQLVFNSTTGALLSSLSIRSLISMNSTTSLQRSGCARRPYAPQGYPPGPH